MTQYPLWQQLNTLKQATWVDLTHTFDPEIPRLVSLKKVKFQLYSRLKIMVSMCNVGIL